MLKMLPQKPQQQEKAAVLVLPMLQKQQQK